MLEYNARDLVHGSYGLEGDHVVLTDTLELDNLDYNEFEASVDSITLAVASHYSRLRRTGRRNRMGIFDRFSTMVRSNLNDLIRG